jgi:NhaP-type Na+/H+ or K+/H+ antiporter
MPFSPLVVSAHLFLARWFAVQGGRLAWRNFTPQERELMIWFLPRGLITAVLGIQVLEARGPQFEFLPSLAFAVILLTNFVLLIGTFRACSLPALVETASSEELPVDEEPLA